MLLDRFYEIERAKTWAFRGDEAAEAVADMCPQWMMRFRGEMARGGGWSSGSAFGQRKSRRTRCSNDVSHPFFASAAVHVLKSAGETSKFHSSALTINFVTLVRSPTAASNCETRPFVVASSHSPSQHRNRDFSRAETRLDDLTFPLENLLGACLLAFRVRGAASQDGGDVREGP